MCFLIGLFGLAQAKENAVFVRETVRKIEKKDRVREKERERERKREKERESGTGGG
jgi:hypothetical protein